MSFKSMPQKLEDVIDLLPFLYEEYTQAAPHRPSVCTVQSDFQLALAW